MEILEIVFAMIGNLKILAWIVAAVCVLVSVFAIGVLAESDNEPGPKYALKLCLKLIIPTLIVALLPSVDDIWKVRIGLIKLQLASPENLQKASDTIERIGKKLECKYIGCDEKKEEAK